MKKNLQNKMIKINLIKIYFDKFNSKINEEEEIKIKFIIQYN